jgi:predicted anti-sigma-YlaC factor YlaD
VDCTEYREELSARMDGEALRVPAAGLDAHVAACAGCASWLRAAEQVTRLARLAPAAALADRTAEILAAVPAVRPRGRSLVRVARLLLAAVALVQAALSYPYLVLGEDSMRAPMHVAHETGAWNAAMAVAFLWVALRPRSATGLLPLTAAFVAMLFAVSLPDLATERVHLERASTHLLTAVGLVLLAVLAWSRSRTHRPRLGGRGVGESGADRSGGEPAAEFEEATRAAGAGGRLRRVPRGNVA